MLERINFTPNGPVHERPAQKKAAATRSAYLVAPVAFTESGNVASEFYLYDSFFFTTSAVIATY